MNQAELAKQLDSSVLSVIGQDTLTGFEKAFQIASATGQLKTLLSPEYMRPIMDLQGNRLGFKTDKDSEGGYKESVVKNCLIEAVLTGVQPFGNQFNIIAGNCYITKEGFGYLLKNFRGLSYDIVPSLPRINNDSTSAAIVMKIKWTLNGTSKEQDLDIPIKMNKFMGTDAVIGKATRKARAWLFNTITGSEIADGDAGEMDARGTKVTAVDTDKELERLTHMINDCKTVEELDNLYEQTPSDLIEKSGDLFNAKRTALNK